MKQKNVLILIIFIILSFLFIPNVFANTPAPEITSPAAILVDDYTGTVIYEKNVDQKMFPASTTKIMTAILAIENCNLSDEATASYDAIMTVPSGYSIGDIKVGETLTVEQLLQVLMVHSANDAANVLGEHVGGSIESFASMMNTKATEIGCKNTHFVNPSGKHDDDHYTTARDLSTIMQYCMKNPTFKKLSSLRECSLPATQFSPQRDFKTTVERLIPNNSDKKSNYYYPYAIAGKTGFTTEAQNCLVSVSKKDNLELTCVILGAGKTEDGYSARFIETKDIFNYGFDNYKIDNICKQNDILKTITVPKGTSETKELPLAVIEDVPVFTNTDDNLSNIEPQINLYDSIAAPITEGTELGEATYNVNGVSYTTKLVATHSVEKSKLEEILFKVGIGLLIIALLGIIILLFKHKKRTQIIMRPFLFN